MSEESTKQWQPFSYGVPVIKSSTISTRKEIPGPDKTRLRSDLLAKPPQPPAFIVKNLLPVNVGTRVGAGGTGKTTLNQWEHLHIVLGLDLYGQKVVKPGAVLTVTKEDEREEDYSYRFEKMLRAMPGLSDVQKRQFLENTYVMELVGTDERLVKVEDGNLLMTDLAEKIINQYRNVGLALIELDPMNFYGAGERFVNDGEAHLMQAGRLISKELKCCVRFSQHTSKNVFRDGIVDMYAGRGGASAADNARFVQLLIRHARCDSRNGKDSYIPPPSIPTFAMDEGNVLRLHIEKMSRAPRIQEPIWLEREHWTFKHHVPPSAIAQRKAQIDAQDLMESQDAGRVTAFIQDELTKGIKHSDSSLARACTLIGMTKVRVQRAVQVAEAVKKIVHTSLPTNERRGSKDYYYAIPGAIGSDQRSTGGVSKK